MRGMHTIDGRSGLRGAKGRRGAALMVSLLCVMVIAGLGATLIQMQTAGARSHAFSVDRRRALYVAEAGIAEAALAVSQGKSGVLASEDLPATFGGGLYWVETSDLPEGRIALVCTARVGTAEFMLRTIVMPNLNPVASLGFFGADGVEIGWGTVADGFHSGRGDYASQVDGSLPVTSTGQHLNLGSNADIVLVEGAAAPPPPPTPPPPTSPPPTKDGGGGAPTGGGWETLVRSTPTGGTPGPGDKGESGGGGTGPPPGPPTRLYGRIKPGPEGSVLSSGHAELIGSMRPMRYPAELPPVTMPAPGEVIVGNHLVSGTEFGVGVKIATEVTGFVTVPAGASLRLVGPTTLKAKKLIVEDGGTLEFDTAGGPVDLYLVDGMNFLTGSTVQSLTPEALSRGTQILVGEETGNPDRITIDCTGTYHGIIYAPSDAVILPAGLRVLGSVVARHLTTAPGAHVSVDRRMMIGGDGLPTLPKIMAWQIVPLGKGTARRLAIEPMLELRLRGITPLASASAAPESNVEVQYVTTAGNEGTYAGPIGGFNPALSDHIIGMRWDDPRGGAPRDWTRPTGEDPSMAVSEARRSRRFARRVIREVASVADVGMLTDEETLDLITSLPNDIIATKSARVQKLDDRVGGGAHRDNTEAPVTFDLDAWLKNTKDKDGTADTATPAPPVGP